ncbi:HD domain-containing protein [Methanobrevibacter curvatus]|uniref:HD domain protein n=1 Tax=Methanobrevibacter curvatus TaxID=49547 RepID=A0A166CIC4_9EURY|nr:HD domain-containing protein [Methanobrevibacter curvatus]KZX14539.1 HD domain protein [Methanobrevibacter curvatus]
MYSKIIEEMIIFFKNDIKRISHSLKVFSLTKTIAELENIPKKDAEIAILSSILHDTGIKIAEDKYGKSTMKHQEKFGPIVAENILNKFNYDKETIERVKFIIANHHHPKISDSIDFKVLIEADYIVNFQEEDIPLSALDNILDNFFTTNSGKKIANLMFK